MLQQFVCLGSNQIYFYDVDEEITLVGPSPVAMTVTGMLFKLRYKEHLVWMLHPDVIGVVATPLNSVELSFIRAPRQTGNPVGTLLP